VTGGWEKDPKEKAAEKVKRESTSCLMTFLRLTAVEKGFPPSADAQRI